MPRRDPKKRRPRATLAEAPAGDRTLEHGDDTPTPGTTQAACRIPTIPEPADPVLRAIHRVRGANLTDPFATYPRVGPSKPVPQNLDRSEVRSGVR